MLRRITIAFDLYGASDGLDLAEIFSAEIDIDRAQILLEPLELARPEQGHDPGLSSQQPGQRDLRRDRPMTLARAAQEIDQRLVRLCGPLARSEGYCRGGNCS